jgi:hypothetical protein
MVGDPRDKTAYSVAIASLGFTLVVALIGLCWLSAQSGDPSSTTTSHHCVLHGPILCGSQVVSTAAVKPPQPPDGLWIALAALGGVLVGALIPLPLTVFLSPSERKSGIRAWCLLVAFVFGAFIVGLVGAALDDLEAPFFWCAVGGVLLGLLIPSPARRD